MLAPFVFGAMQCFLAGNGAAGMALSGFALTLLFAKLWASAHMKSSW
jgi:hypothetical protein